MSITAKTKVCMVIGNPIGHSLSPQIHNAGYRALRIDNDFVYVACQVEIDKMADFVNGVRAMGVRGISCTIPHKIEIMKYLDEVDKTAKEIGAVNTVVNENGKLKGYNTDWMGAVCPFKGMTTLKNKKVALIGAGGTARAVAYGMSEKGAKLFIFNRTRDKAESLAAEYGGTPLSLDDLVEIEQMDIIFNTTSIGLQNENESPVPKELISARHIVFDAVYRPHETKLLRQAKEQGAQVIYGALMLLHQAAAQFKLYTKREAPMEIMREMLLKNLL